VFAYMVRKPFLVLPRSAVRADLEDLALQLEQSPTVSSDFDPSGPTLRFEISRQNARVEGRFAHAHSSSSATR
jgi:hypothetical protein